MSLIYNYNPKLDKERVLEIEEVELDENGLDEFGFDPDDPDYLLYRYDVSALMYYDKLDEYGFDEYGNDINDINFLKRREDSIRIAASFNSNSSFNDDENLGFIMQDDIKRTEHEQQQLFNDQVQQDLLNNINDMNNLF